MSFAEPFVANNSFTNTESYDGDNQLVRFVQGHTVNQQPAYDNGQTTYQLRSSVLGGAVVSEYNAQGAWQVSYVYAGGERVGQQGKAEDGAAWNVWRHVDPVTGDELNTSPAGIFLGQTTLDPQGVDVGVSDPFPANGAGDDDGLLVEDESVPAKRGAASLIGTIEGGAKCVIDGIMQDCGFVRSGVTEQCLNNNCGAHRVTVTHNNGRVITSSSFLVWQGQAGWNGALDGTFHGVPSLGNHFDFSTAAGAAAFVNDVARTGNRPNELYSRVSGGAQQSPLGPVVPQNPAVSPEELKPYRDRIAGMLKDGCSNFLNGLLDEAKAQTGKSYAGILATFDQIKFYWGNTGVSHGGFAYFEHGVPAATISDRVNTEKMGGSLANQRDRHGYLTSVTTDYFLGEILHHVGVGGFYTDAVMARALNAILVRQGLDTHKEFSDLYKDVDNASRYWHPKVWDACPAPRR